MAIRRLAALLAGKQMPPGAARAVKPARGAAPLRSALAATAPLSHQRRKN
jgi:hypothetical protein